VFKIDFAVFDGTGDRNLTDWLADLDRTTAQYSQFSIESASEVTTPVPGIVRSITIDELPVTEYVFKSGERIYRLSGFPMDSPVASSFDSIVQSLTVPG
jgi:hypothetical protein